MLVYWLCNVWPVCHFSEISDFAIHKKNASNHYGDNQISLMIAFDWRSSSLANWLCKFWHIHLRSVISTQKVSWKKLFLLFFFTSNDCRLLNRVFLNEPNTRIPSFSRIQTLIYLSFFRKTLEGLPNSFISLNYLINYKIFLEKINNIL